MPSQSSDSTAARSRNLRRTINAVALVLGLALLIGNLWGAINDSFARSALAGWRSVAAALVPLLIAFYGGYMTRLKVPSNRSEAPVVNNFVVFALWTLMLFWLDARINFVAFPFQALLYAGTLAFMAWRYNRPYPFRTLAACGYGVIVGWLGTLILFGVAAIA
jgi:hypothetical protein